MSTALVFSWVFRFAASSDADGSGSRASRSIRTAQESSNAERVETPSNVEHRALVERIRAGDEAAFERLFREFYPLLCSYVETMGRSADAAEDVVEELFFRLWVSRERWAVTGSVANYLYVAAKNQALKSVARDRSTERLSHRVALEENSEHHERADTDTTLAADHAAIVRRVVSVLPDRSQQVFLLYYRDGLTYAEIADRLGIARKTVENQLSRALKFLAERLKKQLG